MKLGAAAFGASACLWLTVALARLGPGVVGGLGDLPLALAAAAAAGLGAGLLSPGGHKPAEELLSTLLRLLLLLIGYSILSLLYLHPDPSMAHGLAGLLLPPGLFLAHALVMVPPGRALAPALEELGPRPTATLRALWPAALANAAGFALALFHFHPLVLMAIGLSLLLAWAVRLRLPLRGLRLSAILCVVCLVLGGIAGWRQTWTFRHVLLRAPITSQAARLLLPTELTSAHARERPEVWTAVIVDDSLADFAIDLDPVRLDMSSAAAPRASATLSGMAEYVRLPFRLRPPGRTLVVNSGLGNTLAAGMREGWQAMEALEPDSALLRLGRLHPERPYQAPGLVLHRTPAGPFIHRDGPDYDLIVLAPILADRLFYRFYGNTRAAPLYTAETMHDLAGRLSPDGVVAVMLSVPHGYIEKRLFQMMVKQFGRAAAWSWTNAAWSQRWTLIAAGPGISRYRPRPGPGLIDRTAELGQGQPINPATRAWPYLFYPNRTLPFILALTMVAMIAMAAGVLVPQATIRAVDPAAAAAGILAGCVVMLWSSAWLGTVPAGMVAGVLLLVLPAVSRAAGVARRQGSALSGFGIFLATAPLVYPLGTLWPQAAAAVALVAVVALRLRHA